MGLSRNRDDIKETSGTIHYSTNFNIDWPTGSYNHTTSYSGTICGIQVYDIDGSVTVFNLDKGIPYSYSNNTITCHYSYNYKVTITGTDAQGKPTSTEVEKSGSGQIKNDLGSITIYTHPGSFSMDATSDSNSSNSIIANVLTKEKIDKWIQHYQKAYHWYNQNNINYSIDLSITKDESIKATWFNKCMTAMNVFDNKNYKTDYRGGANGDLITAAAINQMNFSGIN